ncbi:MAG: hypothetical protein AAGA95_19535 [Pseudomonadota bacterium]
MSESKSLKERIVDFQWELGPILEWIQDTALLDIERLGVWGWVIVLAVGTFICLRIPILHAVTGYIIAAIVRTGGTFASTVFSGTFLLLLHSTGKTVASAIIRLLRYAFSKPPNELDQRE